MATGTIAASRESAKTSGFRLRSLENRRFRWLLLAMAAAGIVPAFVWMVLLYPLVAHGRPSDDLSSYINAARLLDHGFDPYAPWFADHSADPTRRHGYIYPPVFAWLLGPVAFLPASIVLAGSLAIELMLLAGFLLIVFRDLAIRDRQLMVVLVLATIGFFPVHQNFQWGQVNLALLLLSAIWLRSWRGGPDWIGGTALGVSIAVKLLQAPVLLAVAAKRRWEMAVAAAFAIVVTWLLAAPAFLPEYFMRIVPALAQGTAWSANLAPVALLARLARPESMSGGAGSVAPGIHTLGLLLGAGALAATVWFVRNSPDDREARSLQAAAVVAAAPLASTIVWPAQAALLLLPMLILVRHAINRRDLLAVAGVAVAWLLLGPVQELAWGLGATAAGFRDNYPAIWALSQASALGLWLTWLIALRSLHSWRPENA